jgi:hypothetical protein
LWAAKFPKICSHAIAAWALGGENDGERRAGVIAFDPLDESPVKMFPVI